MKAGITKKLTPFFRQHRSYVKEFLTKFWDFYRDLLGYTSNPSLEVATKLSNNFDDLFSTITGYDALDQRIALTKDKKRCATIGAEISIFAIA